MILSKEQRVGALILISIALAGWFIVAVFRGHQTDPVPAPEGVKAKRSWAERKDSIRIADSLRYVQWAQEREQRYDSFRIADSLRREEWKRIRQQKYDSFRIADSLWKDSVGWKRYDRVKKDTVIDLNHCDTTDLLYIRGIGKYSAIQIVRYRERLGGYYSPVQLTDSFFSRCHLDTLLPHFTADTTAIKRIEVNRATMEQLSRHPYISLKQAKAIYTLRRQRVYIRDLEELKSLKELQEEEIGRIAPYLSFERRK